MENTEKINEIILFLNKNYHVKESKYFNRLDEHEWGLNIIELLNNVSEIVKNLFNLFFIKGTNK